LARHEKDFEAAEETELPRIEALSLSAARRGNPDGVSRDDALACFLSAADGWLDALRRLDGAFADCPAVKHDGKDIAER
jgi:hypothetical protein